jgi:hypothetical protein
MRTRSSKRPRDANQLAKLLVDLATDEMEKEPSREETQKNPHAVALGRLGGPKGGAARAERMSAERRSEIARLAARARWSREKRHDD